jgi:transposase-like protein
MQKCTDASALATRTCWTELENLIRERVQTMVQDLLEAEVQELLGRTKSQRRAGVDAPEGYRNGLGRPRRLTTTCGTITVRRPRVRGLQERFESRILPHFVTRTRRSELLLPELYLHGLSMGDFDLALRGLLGDEAPLSPSTLARLKAGWQVEFDEWRRRDLSDLDLVYLWADGIYLRAGLEKEKAALLVLVGGLSDGQKVVLAVQAGHRESVESWSALLRDLQARGLRPPKLVIADGHLGLWGGLANIYPRADEQRCWNHRIVNVMDKLPRKAQKEALLMLKKIPYAQTRREAERRRNIFQAWCRKHGHEEAAAVMDRDWERMVAFYRYPEDHWVHLRTTNIIESPFAAVRLRTNAAKRFKKTANGTALVWKLLMVAERRFRRLKGAHLLPGVLAGDVYIDGIKQEAQLDKVPA